MIRYTFYQKNPASHYIYIDMEIDQPAPELHLQLPAWRPGRYELGNFAKNVKRVDVFDQDGKSLTYSKQNKDLWQVNTNGASKIKVTYSYYAAELNAGACYADIHQLYVNPVHCCLYVPERMNETHEVVLNVPQHYKVVTSLPTNQFLLTAANYDELVDSPFIAADAVQSDFYVCGERKFHLHFIGDCRPDWPKLKTDFKAFTEKQLQFWGDCPTNEYHFIFEITNHKFYHGVEHLNSTMIAIGPGYAFNTAVYEDVLGVSSHELFHVWNIKYIRPAEMLPYNYTHENYARTGFVYEGFTTYYGDKMLLAAEVFTTSQYFETLQERLVKHFHNYGRYNLSVADSSWETWLDGYQPGAPYRKTNIYDEGCLIAFMLDAKILALTNNQRSLRDVCVLLYERFGKAGKGYTESAITALVNEVAGSDLTSFFNDYVYAPADFEKPLLEAMNYLGISMEKQPSMHASEALFGFKTQESALGTKVTLVAPYSPAWKAGLFAGDDVLAVNNRMVRNNLSHLLLYFEGEGITLTINSGEELRSLSLPSAKREALWFFNPVLQRATAGHFDDWKNK